MTAHSHPQAMSRPSLSSKEQEPLLGTPQEVVLVNHFIDACWRDCEVCMENAIDDVASRPGTFLALRRAYRLQETGKLKWAHGTAEGDAEVSKLASFDTDTMRQLTLAAGRIWVARALLFDAVEQIGKCDGEPRLLSRPKINRPGQRNRQR